MAHLTADRTQVNARIVFWGISGAGVSTNLRVIHDKLRADHRGELKAVPTRLDPTTSYEILPIELGQVNGLRTQLQIVGVPCGEEHAPTRKQLLDRVDGIVMVIDSRSERLDDNLASLDELRTSLAAYGRSLDEVPLVVQYNKRDLADPYALEELHRKLDLGSSTVFEAVATEGSGVLQTLSTISKRVIRSLRGRPDTERGLAPVPEPEAPPERVTPSLENAPVERPESSASARMEEAILGEDMHPEAEAIESLTRTTEELLDAPAWPEIAGEIERPRGARIGPGLTIVSVGEATRAGERKVRVPLVLGDPDGETATVVLTIQLDPLVDEHR